MWALKILLLLALLYVAIVAAFYFAQTSLIFPARMVQGAGPLPPGAERLTLATPDGETLHGVHLPPRYRRGRELPLILAFPGNAWNAEDCAEYVRDLYPDADVVAFHFRGYRPSTGRPAARALLADAPLVHDFLKERFPGRPIVAVGISIGTGVAGHLAAVRPIAGAILVTPFDSLAEVGSRHYPWLPVRLALRHRMNPARDLHASRVPIALLIAGKDRIIPPERGEALARAVPNLVFKRRIEGAGHNDIFQYSAFQQAMDEALAAIEAAGKGPPQK